MNILYLLDFSSGKSYIGITTESMSRRWSGHLKDVKKGSRKLVHAAWRKYGPPRCTVLAILELDDLCDAERKAIDVFRTFMPHGYNMTRGGEVSPTTDPEIAAKVSAALKGIPKSIEHRQKLSLSRMGMKPSAETRAKLSAARRIRRHSAETRKKIGNAHRGMKRSAETRVNMVKGNAHRRGRPGRKWSAEAKLSLSLQKRGHQVTPQAREKISNANLARLSAVRDWVYSIQPR